MKAILFLAALMPLGVLAQPININNNPNQPGYVVPSQQRMQNEMKVQQQQQQSMLKQAKTDSALLAQAEARARTILEQYVRNVLGDDAKNWTIEFKDVQ